MVEIPEKEEGMWLLNENGSARPVSGELAEEMSYDYVDEDYDAVHPEYKDKNYKAVYKKGGPRRTQ